MSVTRPAIRYFGGKWRLAPWIVGNFPTHSVFTEAYGGGASVLLRKERCYAEVYNDLDGELVNLFQVLRGRGEELERALYLTPYARGEFELSYLSSSDELEQARRTVVRSYMGFGSTMTRLTRKGRLMRTGFRDYSGNNRGSIPAHDWKNYVEALPDLVNRLRGVIIENRPALQILIKHDSAETLHYVDPPYLHSTRGRSDGYRFEMTEDDHTELSRSLHQLTGMVVLSGYNSELYKRLYPGWRVESTDCHADGNRDRVEVLWFSPNCTMVGDKQKEAA